MFFNLPRKGQLALSSSSIKLMAKVFGETGHADVAVRAALRNDTPSKLSVMLNGSEQTLDNQVIWAFGTTGAGSTEMAVSFAKENSARGGKTCFITPRTILHRLPAQETYYSGLGWNLDYISENVKMLDHPFCVLTVRNVCRSVKDHAADFLSALKVVDLLDADLIVLDDVLWNIYPAEAAAFIDKMRNLGKRLIVMSMEWRLVPRDAIIPSDAVLLMRSVTGEEYQKDLFSRLPWFTHEPPQHEDVVHFQPGEGFLVSLTKFGSFVIHYRDTDESYLPDPAVRAVKMLSGENRRGTYMARLDAAARACGYRSWHAAEGRNRKDVLGIHNP